MHCLRLRRLAGSIRSMSYVVRPCLQLRNSTFPEYVSSPQLQLHNIIWRAPLQNIYVCKKPSNDRVSKATTAILRHIHDTYPSVNVIVSQETSRELEESSDGDGDDTIPLYTGSVEEIVAKTDLIVTLGGDGTILRAVSTFLNANVPPVLSFALGTLGFLLPFDFDNFDATFQKVYQSRAKALHRSRLECHVVRGGTTIESNLRTMQHAMNDISLHRGLQPNLTALDIYIDGQLLTTSTADGLVLATPTGSTAYNLLAGGSITHPLVECILLTPICPRLLLFRPLILPLTLHVMIRMSEGNRNHAIKLNIDGIPQVDLRAGDQIHILSENGTTNVSGVPRPPPREAAVASLPDTTKQGQRHRGIWCVARGENDWTLDINELLGFNTRFKVKQKL